MASFKKVLILLMVLIAMYLAYVAVHFLKSKIDVRGNVGAFLLLLVLSFTTIFLIILILGFLLVEFKDFFFKH